MDQTFEKRKKVILDFISDDMYVPMKIKEIAIVLQIPREQRDDLKEVLDVLVEEGKISLSKRGKYSKGQAVRLKGVFQANARGFGFVTPEDGAEDVFIPEENISGAFQGDQVEYIITAAPSGRRREGKIVRILSHSVVHIVGLYEKSKNFGFVRPDNQRYLKDIYIPAGKEKGAMNGHKVVVELTSYGGENMKPEGTVVEIIGHINDPGTDILSVVMDAGIPTEFSEKVLNQAVRVSKEVSEADRAGRKDLRDWLMVTIDGEDAKDLDDAVSLQTIDGNYVLGVHIADVTNYVQENSALDREAFERGTSVYLADRVIPMLPHKLSNGICSLNAGEDRLALSCIMTFDQAGEMIDHEIVETVIHVDKRMSYNGVAKILDGNTEETGTDQEIVSMLLSMKKLSDILRERRGRRGSIDFDFPETKVILDENGKPVDIRPYERNDATKIIEDFMLMANETVAEEYYWRELPFIYRTHEVPDEDKIRKLSTFINNFGYHIHVRNEVRPKEIQKLLDKVDGTPEEALISRLTLRSMKQARYTTENTGHFGLAAKYYTHFTSPIRRYPDLQIHRIIKENLRGRLNEDRISHYEEILSRVAAQCSDRERRAEEAEREVVKMKKAEYMRSHIGEEYDGVISGVTKWGIYVELANTVEGLVHVADMRDDHYEFAEQTYELVGEHSGKIYKLGQTVRVRVADADKLQRTVNFEIVS
ncbi:ribonuclease R [Mediterraneibacter glycyrrhizinilyticus]|uniref:ribonuclease R n=1 Tax=Mediterraneibacter glycyrrhizinilyticus TaxID=342942 RepID=UPI0025AB242B|nr:ribonuclease R [Mediterraneibacter glycyrrhizinilyticus]MDN0061024.1 ribonuclease R [Mediterraneibacter glycyrrhizinilyticus]